MRPQLSRAVYWRLCKAGREPGESIEDCAPFLQEVVRQYRDKGGAELLIVKGKIAEWPCLTFLRFGKGKQEKRMAVEEIKLIKRGGLRVYIDPAGLDVRGEPGVFYSRRSCGPYYRWSFENDSVRWRSSRVHPSALSVKAFCVAGWTTVPPGLQMRLDEHYLE